MKQYVFLLIFLLFTAKKINATPLFAMQSAEKCNTCHSMPDRSQPKWVEENYKLADRKCRLSCSVCHTNRSGGMLRNDVGIYFGTKTLPATPKKEVKKIPDDIKAYLSRFSIGGDFRFLALVSEKEENPAFFPMQADIYLDLTINDDLLFLYQGGMKRGGNPATKEVGVIKHNMPYNAYFKLGKFMPPFGLKLDDHTAFIREKNGFDNSKPSSYRTGYEIGAEPLGVYGRFSQFDADVTPARNNENTVRGISAVAGWRGLFLHLGGSYIKTENVQTDIDRNIYGISGIIRGGNIKYLKKLSYMFEFDFRVDENRANQITSRANISFNELNYIVTKGINLKLRYETFAPDENSIETDENRYIAGIDFFPVPHTQLNLQYRNTEIKPLEKNSELLFIYHLWF